MAECPRGSLPTGDRKLDGTCSWLSVRTSTRPARTRCRPHGGPAYCVARANRARSPAACVIWHKRCSALT